MAKSALMRRAVEGDTAGRLLSVADVSRAALWLLQRPLEESPTTLFLAGSNGKWYRLEDRAPLHSVGGAGVHTTSAHNKCTQQVHTTSAHSGWCAVDVVHVLCCTHVVDDWVV